MRVVQPPSVRVLLVYELIVYGYSVYEFFVYVFYVYEFFVYGYWVYEFYVYELKVYELTMYGSEGCTSIQCTGGERSESVRVFGVRDMIHPNQQPSYYDGSITNDFSGVNEQVSNEQPPSPSSPSSNQQPSYYDGSITNDFSGVNEQVSNEQPPSPSSFSSNQQPSYYDGSITNDFSGVNEQVSNEQPLSPPLRKRDLSISSDVMDEYDELEMSNNEVLSHGPFYDKVKRQRCFKVSTEELSDCKQRLMSNSLDDKIRNLTYKLLDKISHENGIIIPYTDGITANVRRLLPQERHDTKFQKYALEIDVKQKKFSEVQAEIKNNPVKKKEFLRLHRQQARGYDYSMKLINELSPEHKAKMDDEIKQFIDLGYWEPLSQEDIASIDKSKVIISRPLVQGCHKTTKCRLVSDARYVNFFTPRAGRTKEDPFWMTTLARSRYQRNHSLWFLDLKKAFYRVRQRRGQFSYLKCNNIYFRSSRIIFGVQHGPASLFAATLLLEQLAFTVFDVLMNLISEKDAVVDFHYLDKPTQRDDIEITIAYFFDDFMVSGPDDLVLIFKKILCVVAECFGFEFPDDKMEKIVVNKPNHNRASRHLGAMWSLNDDLSLRIDCIPPDDIPSEEIMQLTKRRVFQHTGKLHETTREHGMTHYINNSLKMWAGVIGLPTDKKSWNSKLNLDQPQRERYKELLGHGLSQLRGCSGHFSIEDRCELIGFSDSSKECCAFAIFAGRDLHRGPDSIDIVDKITLQEGTYLFKEHKAEWNWHTNRKEFFGLVLLCENILLWCLQRHPIHQERFGAYHVTIFTDSDVSRAWAQQGYGNKFLAKLAKTDQNGVAKLVDRLNDVKKALSEHGISLCFEHIAAHLNGLSDYLSRLPDKIPMPDPISDPFPREEAESSDLMVDDFTGFPNVIVDEVVVKLIDDDGIEDDMDPEMVSMNDEDNDVDNARILLEDSELRLLLKEPLSSFNDQLRDRQYVSNDVLYKVPIKELFAFLEGRSRNDFVYAFYDECNKLCSLHHRVGLDDHERLVIQAHHQDAMAKVYVPSGLCRDYLFYKNHYDPLSAAHIGGQRCYENIKQKYFWPNMARDIRNYVKGCAACQKSKCTTLPNSTRIRSVRLEPPKRFQRLQVDFFSAREDSDNVPISTAGGNAALTTPYFVSIIDCGTKLATLYPAAKEDTDSAITALLLWSQAFGKPYQIQTDGSSAFTSSKFSSFMNVWDVDHFTGFPYEPECQGLVERLHGFIRGANRAANFDNCRPGLSWLISTMIAVNQHNVTQLPGYGISPCELAFGMEDLLLDDAIIDRSVILNDEFVTKLKDFTDLQYLAYCSLRRDDAAKKEFLSLMASPLRPLKKYSIGDMVYWFPYDSNHQRLRKGPYKVMGVNGDDSYRLENVNQNVHADALAPQVVSAKDDAFQMAADDVKGQINELLIDKCPNSKSLDDIAKGDFIIWFDMEGDYSNRTKTGYVVEFVERLPNGQIRVQDLSQRPSGTWSREKGFCWNARPEDCWFNQQLTSLVSLLTY